MAQERARRARGLARRYGVSGRAAVAAALALLVAACVVAALFAGPALAGGGVAVERADEGAAAPVAPEGAEEEAAAEDAGASEDEAARTLLVHVDGAVAAPGVYELPGGARANDAVAAAGGLAEDADTTSLNLAAPLSDGEKLHVPREGEEAAAPAASDAGASGQGAQTGLVNLNSATVEELDTLPGVGESTARAIVEDREANGPFTAPEDLMRVSGIGEKKFERIRGLVCV
ncbi:ComEA family DNA-binding protein [Thermophilibacter sp.]